LYETTGAPTTWGTPVSLFQIAKKDTTQPAGPRCRPNGHDSAAAVADVDDDQNVQTVQFPLFYDESEKEIEWASLKMR
jgi:hypothetical protein